MEKSPKGKETLKQSQEWILGWPAAPGVLGGGVCGDGAGRSLGGGQRGYLENHLQSVGQPASPHATPTFRSAVSEGPTG